MQLFQAWDVVAKGCLPVFDAENQVAASAAFFRQLRTMGLPPKDFVLYRVGEYDTAAVAITALSPVACDHFELLKSGSEAIKNE